MSKPLELRVFQRTIERDAFASSQVATWLFEDLFMDTRNSALIVGLYLLCIVIIGAACFAYYSYERSTNPPSSLADADTFAPQSKNRSPSPVYSAAVAKAKAVRDLQSSLAANRELLDRQTAALNQKTAECKALREQLDHSFMLLLSLLNEDSNATTDTGDATTELRASLDTEIARLKQTLGTPKTSETDQEQHVLQLQAELMQADLHLEAVEQQSQRELELVLSEKRTVEQAASDLIARCGAAAIPLLVDLLSDERVEVRRWAAKALGVIGPEARDVSGVLRELLSDPDPTVRTEVERALVKID